MTDNTRRTTYQIRGRVSSYQSHHDSIDILFTNPSMDRPILLYRSKNKDFINNIINKYKLDKAFKKTLEIYSETDSSVSINIVDQGYIVDPSTTVESSKCCCTIL